MRLPLAKRPSPLSGSGLLALLLALAPGRPAGAQDGWSWGDVQVPQGVAETPELRREGKKIFESTCFVCHGKGGHADGVAAGYLAIPPADLASGRFKIRSTATGHPPADADLFRTVTVGFPDYGMPRFAYLSTRERWALVSYVKTLSKAFQGNPDRSPLALGRAPARTAEMIREGKELYVDYGCAKCHGLTGRGDGPSGAFLTDSSGRPAIARDFTVGPQAFKGGSTARDIARTFMTGLTGSAMPAYEGLAERDAWAMAYYVESLIER